MNYPLNDADLALIEINNPTPLVARLVEQIKALRDENVKLKVGWEQAEDDACHHSDRADDAEDRVAELEEQLAALEDAQ